jgi:uncharacterized protein YjbJ (UPF0337 family)
MDDRIEGKAKEAEGKLTGDQGREAEGKAQDALGHAKDAAESAADAARAKLDDLKTGPAGPTPSGGWSRAGAPDGVGHRSDHAAAGALGRLLRPP